jgi:hypothetical protein
MRPGTSMALAVCGVIVVVAIALCLCWESVNALLGGKRGPYEDGRWALWSLIHHPAMWDLAGLIAGLCVAALILQRVAAGLQARWGRRKHDLQTLVEKADRVISGRLSLNERQLTDLAVELSGKVSRAAEQQSLDTDTIAAYRRRAKSLFDIIEAGPSRGR